MDTDRLLEVLDDAVAAVARSLAGLDDWGPAGTRPGQYRCDLAADAAVLEVLLGAGLGVLSEESGLTSADRELLAVVDPVDGSTNAAHGIPWFATSICVLDGDGPLVAVVANQASGEVFRAVRDGGASCDGDELGPSSCDEVSRALVALSGLPERRPPWAQSRILGAAALDMCAVAQGVVDGFRDCGPGALGPWDYLGGLLVCLEAGAVVADAYGRDLVVRGHGDRRAPVAAASPELLEALIAVTSGGGGPADALDAGKSGSTQKMG